MKPVTCIPEEALGEVLELPEDDPRRAHLESCPRCRALVVSYRAFLAPGAATSAAYGAEEERALDAARERLVGPVSAGSPATGRSAVAPAPKRSWWTVLVSPTLRPAWALAAVLVIMTLAVLLPRMRGDDGGSRVRGLTESPLAPTAEPVIGADGSVRLAWHAAEGADRYEVRFFSAALDPVASLDAGADTSVTIPAHRMPGAFDRGELLLYRVIAFREGDELASSETRPLQMR